jgi:single-strand DNA-binding protein
MINEPQITIAGNLATDPELRYTPTGQPVASFSVASNPRFRNAAGEWENGTTVFLRVTAWRDLAENICNSLKRGDPIIVVGRFRQRTWKADDGTDRRTDEIQADKVGVDLDRRIVRMTKVTRDKREPDSQPDGSESPGNGTDVFAGTESPASADADSPATSGTAGK